MILIIRIDDPDTVIHVRLLVWHRKFGKLKAIKKKLNEELMLVASHPPYKMVGLVLSRR